MTYLAAVFVGIVTALILDFGVLELAMLLALGLFARRSFARRSRLPIVWLRFVRRIAGRPAWAYGSILLLAILPRALYLAATGPPVPFVTDEFSYRLQADTLESGRLTNPTHPHWEFFETIHVIPKPTYQSQYLPGAALFLAAGKLAFGHHLYGVWLSAVLLFLALLWNLRQWFSPTWAWFATALATIRFGVGSYWVDSYWGGAVPALGGTLLLGSVAAAVTGRRVSWPQGLAFGAGAGLLLATRPWEGAALGVGCSAVLCWALLRRRERLGRFLAGFAAPAVLLFLAAVIALGGYVAAVTGSPFSIPYQVNLELYGWPITLPWMNPVDHHPRQAQMRLYYQWEVSEHESVTTLSGFLLQTPYKLSVMWRFFFGPMLSVLLWAIFRNRRSLRWPWLFLLCAAPAFLAVAIEQSWYPHYLSPALAALIGVWAIGLREMQRWRFPKARDRAGTNRAVFAGWFLALVLPAHLLLLGLSGMSRATGRSFQPGLNALTWCCINGGNLDRSKAEREILDQGRREGAPDGGRHVVFVSAPETYLNPSQWTYNRADIDASQIVWAADLGPEKNQELLRYFPQRKPWRAWTDFYGYILLPYGQPFPDLNPRLERLDAEHRGIRGSEESTGVPYPRR